MQIKYADLVGQTSTTTGTGTYSMSGTITGMQGFDAVGNGAYTHYKAAMGSDWEIGIGLIATGSPNQLSRQRILSSSNSGNAVSWSAGTKEIRVVIPSARYLGAALTENVDNFTELLDAVEYMTAQYRQFISEGINCVVNLATGFEWTGQLVVNAQNLGFITLTADDASVPVIRSQLTLGANAMSFATNANMNSMRPAILGYNGAQIPRLSALLDMDTSGSTSESYAGILLHGNSGAVVLEGAGVINVVKPGVGESGRGCNISHGSFLTGWASRWTGCHIGARVSNVSAASLREAVLSGCEYGIDTNGTSRVGAQDSDLSGCTYHSIWASGASVVKADDADCSGTGTGGTTVDHAAILGESNAIIDAPSADVSGSGRGVWADTGATINFKAGVCQATLSSGLVAIRGGRIVANGGAEVSGVLAGAAVECGRGGWIDITGSSVINNTAVSGVLADGGTVIAGTGTTITGNAGGTGASGSNRDIRIRNGGIVDANGARTTNGGSPGVVAMADTSLAVANFQYAAGIIHTSTEPPIRYGSGTPEGAVTAPVGTIFLRSNGGASTTFYVKESGTGNTGWRAV